MTDNGLILVKYWLEVSKEEQARRFEARVNDPLRQWKLSPMDVESWNRWDDYTKARDEMLGPPTHRMRRGTSSARTTRKPPV